MPDNDALRSRSLVFPVLLVAIGTLFLIRTWQPAFHPWPVIRTYWPLILVFVGLGKMWDAFQGARQSRSGVSIGSTVGVLLFVVVIVVLLWRGHTFADHDGRYRDLVDHTSETRDLQGATSLKADLTVPAGTTLTWVNNDPEEHDVLPSDPSFSLDPNFFTPPIAPGMSWSYTFTVPGTYAYMCDLHVNMNGNVNVA